MAKKNIVIDTSVFLTDAQCIFKFDNNDIFIPLKVLEEIDKHKTRQDSVGFNARNAIKNFDALRARGSLSKGVRLNKGKGILRVIKASEICLEELPRDLSHKIADHLILATALTIQAEAPRRKCVVMSRDINMRVIADALGLLTEDYSITQVVDDADKIYNGFTSVLVDDETIDQFYKGEDIIIDPEILLEQKITLYPHEFVMLVSLANEKKTALARYEDPIHPLLHIYDNKEELSFNVHPRNKEQSFSFDLLMRLAITLSSCSS